jgi:hypothetical protein
MSISQLEAVPNPIVAGLYEAGSSTLPGSQTPATTF